MSPANPPTQSDDDYQAANVFDLLSLKDWVVVITGGAKGIGLALGFAVAEAGASVAIIDAAPEPNNAYKNLQTISPKTGFYQYGTLLPLQANVLGCSMAKLTVFYRSDVTDFERLRSTFASISRDFGRIDSLLVRPHRSHHVPN